MPHSLFEDFNEKGYHSSILSTFSVDPAFYDASLQFRLRRQGCQNNLLIADATMLDQSLEAVPDAFPNAGRKYLIAPIATAACFHPKLALRYGKAKARLIVGSANVTSAGWAGNLELISSLTWNARDDDEDDSRVHHTLIVRAHRWLSSLVENTNDNKVSYKLELLRSQSQWLDSDVLESSGPFQLADGTEIDILLSDPSDEIGLGDRMIKLVDEPVDELTIISPYWDTQLSALKRLNDAADNPKLRIFISQNDRNPSRSSTFPVDAIGELALTFHLIQPDGQNSDRFLHAKMFLFHGTHHDFFFIGSANCTSAALGTPSHSGTNHECLLYRKLPRGTVEKLLNLTFKSTIELSDIVAPPEKSEPTVNTTTFTAGSVERRANRLLWMPASNAPNSAESIQIGETDFRLSLRGDGLWQADAGDMALESNIARICLNDGRRSRPMIISNPEQLMRFATFPVADSLRRKLDAVLNGNADLIGLAKDINLLLEDDAKIGPSLERVRAAGRRSSSQSVAGRDFATPEEFRNALNLRASMKSAGLSHDENPALQALLQIVLRGLINVETIDEIDAQDAVAAKAHDVGEDQDDVGQPDDEVAPPNPQPTFEHIPQVVSTKEFEQNQNALRRGIEKFQKFLDHAKDTDAELDLNFVTRSLFMLYLMLHGCTKRYEIEKEETKVLIPFSGGPNDDFQDSFLFVAAQAIASIWGPNFARSLIGRLRFTAESNSLPIQITTLTIISRWVLAAILSEVRTMSAHKSLSAILETQVPKLFEATKVFPELDQEEMLATICQMESNIGMDADQAARNRIVLQEMNAPKTA